MLDAVVLHPDSTMELENVFREGNLALLSREYLIISITMLNK
jgi:hypothetical protein